MPAITAALGAFLLIGNVSMLTLATTAITAVFGDPLLVSVALAIAGLVNASLIITGGKIGYMNGLRRALLIGLIIFIVGNIVAGLSLNSLMFLVGFALIMPLGFILAFPATGSLLIAKYEGKQRNIAFGIYAGFIGLTSALAPLLMGTFASFIDWRLMFAYQILLAVIIMLLLRTFTETKKYPGTIDWIGTLFIILAFAPLILGLALLSVNLLYSILIVVGALFFGVFWWWSTRLDKADRNPIFRVQIFRNRVFTIMVIYVFVYTFAAGGTIYLFPQILQGLGFPAFDTALITLAYTLPVFFVAFVAGNLGERFQPKYLIIIGTVFIIVGLSALFIVPGLPIFAIIGILLLIGVGAGLILPYVQNIALSSVDTTNVGEASGMYMSIQELGAAVGAAIIAAIAITAGYVFVAGITLAVIVALFIPRTHQS